MMNSQLAQKRTAYRTLVLAAMLLLLAGYSALGLPAAASAAEQTPASGSATFAITWSDTCQNPPPEAIDALETAATSWGTLLASPVPVVVNACWQEPFSCGGDALGCGRALRYLRNFAGAPLVDVYYPVALANSLAGRDLAPGVADITLTFRADADWSYGRSPAASADFQTVAMHELAHGLGFVGHMYVSYGVGYCGDGPFGFLYPCPTAYDWFAVDGDGTALLESATPDPRDLASRLLGDSHFGGANVRLVHGRPAPLYTPPTWQQGSSFSHLEPTIFDGSADRLMLPIYTGSARQPGPLTIALFQDLGWRRADGGTMVTMAGPPTLPVGTTGTFSGTLSSAHYMGQPIAYGWSATAQEPVTDTVAAPTSVWNLAWFAPGMKQVVVTAQAGGISGGATRTVLAFAVDVAGPASGASGQSLAFTAALAPAGTALPVTYIWSASGFDPVTHDNRGTTDTVTFSWSVPGPKTVTVFASLGGEMAQASQTITLTENDRPHAVFLPALQARP